MNKPKRSFWAMLMVVSMALLAPFAGSVIARGGGGGGGRGGGGGGGRGGGRGGRGGLSPAAARGNRSGNNSRNQRKEEQERKRREARNERVAAARIIYAKRERQDQWDRETREWLRRGLNRTLGGSTE